MSREMQPTLFKTQVSCLRRKFFPAVLCYTNIGLLCKGDGTMQIAIVDDRAEDREELSACLENYMKKHQLDYTLTEFEDGENFLKAAAQVNFQLVFMDIYMENMDGIEAARRLRQKNRLCKIVFLTITEDYARMGYSLSASYYLLKPLSLHQADFE